MRNNFTFCKLLLICILMGSVFLSGINAQEYVNGVMQGKFRIKVSPSLGQAVNPQLQANQTVKTGIQSLNALNQAYSVSNMERLFKPVSGLEAKFEKHGLHLWYEITVGAQVATQEAISSYAALGEVSIAEAIYEKVLVNPGEPRILNSPVPTSSTGNEPFNDPYLPMQWHYNNTGQSAGTPGADIKLFDAWKIETGASNVIVSIHDQGIQYDHEDLAGNMWVNEDELNGDPGVDDDNNGFVDDVYGFNFAGNRGDIAPGYHGTHVAGTVGAMNHNGIGVAGVAGGDSISPGVRLMSCQILGETGGGNIPSSYVYAANNGAVISQNSWGYSAPDVIEQSILDAIDYFIKEAGNYPGSPMKGGIVIFAAGNSNYDGKWYPGYYENCISVVALNASNVKTGYSNYGTWCDIAAPGGQAEDDINLSPENAAAGYGNGVLSTFTGNGYGYLDGTSMACPHVSGIAALVVSKYGSSSFTPEELKRHLLTGLSDIYHIEANQEYLGKLGLGATNALLALAENTGIAPEAISDLTLNSVAQDFAMLEWTVPADTDDGIPYNFEILYSKDTIDAPGLEFASRKVIKCDSSLGQKIIFEVQGLDALTKYYFNVRSIDRWGNTSDFSNEVSATTNDGPDAWVDKSGFDYELIYLGYDPVTYERYYDTVYYLPVNIDAGINVQGSNSFYLHNTGKGLLRWDYEQRHIESIDATSVEQILPPAQVPPLGFKPEIKAHIAPKSSVQTYAQEKENKYLSYFNYWGNYYFIGETDTAYSNSAATKFTITDPEGFNLTRLGVGMNYESSASAPAVVEIYVGENISDAKITYQQELTETMIGENLVILEEQIFMNPGTTFWVVLHIPAGNLYPLMGGVELSPEYSKNCYISLNLGKSWSLIEDLYYNNIVVWNVTAVSSLKTTGEYITLTPGSGDVPTMDSLQLTASTDASQMINGKYKSNVLLNTNEVGEPMLRVPTYVNVEGHLPVIRSEQVINFGSVFLGSEKVVEVTLNNDGYGLFKWPNVAIDNPEFQLVGSLRSINARTAQTIKVLFKPTKTGNCNGLVTVTDFNGNIYEFNLFGVGAEPPVMEVSPMSLFYDSLNIGDTVNGEFYVKNTGDYPLLYYFPGFANGSNVGQVSSEQSLFGYTAKHNDGGILTNPKFEWIDISATGTAVTNYSRDYSYWYHPVDLGFSFPFFGKFRDKLYINNFGIVSFDTDCVFNYWPLGFDNIYNPTAFISAMGFEHDLSAGGNVYYQDYGDRFIVQYDKVIYNVFSWMANDYVNYEFTYQVVLYSDGNINIYYQDLGGVDPFETEIAFIAIEDRSVDINDGLLVNDPEHLNLSIGNNTVVEFYNPGLGLVYDLSNAEGTVQVGDSVRVEFYADTDILNVGEHTEKIPLLSNDPLNNPGIFDLVLNVTGGGVAELSLSDTLFNWGDVFQADVVANNIWVVNTGRANDTVASVSFINNFFVYNGVQQQIVTPNKKFALEVAPKSQNLGAITDTLVITTNNGVSYKTTLKANIIPAPEIEINIPAISEVLEAGTNVTHRLTVTNNGGSPLDVAPLGNDWLTTAEIAVSAMDVKDFAYHWTSSNTDGLPLYQWEDIRNTGTPVDSTSPDPSTGLEFWSKPIVLPFNFNFYGIEYDTLYIGYNGVLTFTEDYGNHYIFGPNATIPNSIVPNNLIAPMWGFIFADYMSEGSGISYTMDTSKVIVQWSLYRDGYGMGQPISFQAILYKEGNIKFQYNFEESFMQAVTGFSMAGIENATGTDGVIVSIRQDNIITDKTAINLAPIQKYTVAPGTSKDILVNVSAKELVAGNYFADLKLLNNTPGTGEINIPVDLTVTGEANLPASDSIGFGDVFAMEIPDANPWDPSHVTYMQEFEIRNTGAADAQVISFDQSRLQNTSIEVFATVFDWWTGGTMESWVNLNDLFDPQVIKAKSSLKFRVYFMPTMAVMLRDTLLVSTDAAVNPEVQISFAANALVPPVIGSTNKHIVVRAEPADDIINYTHYINNLLGGSDLKYNMDISFIRKNEIAPSSNNVNTYSNNPIEFLQVNPVDYSTWVETKARSSFNRILEYETVTVPDNQLGYNGRSKFVTATQFTAPGDGFNLTHVQNWYVPGDWLNSKIMVEIYAGDPNIYNASVIHSQEYLYDIPEKDSLGSLLTFKLDNNLLFYPNEDFFVVFTYETGVTHPQGVYSTSERIEGRYLFTDGGDTWYDMAAIGYDYGFIVKAVESEAGSNAWVELVSTSGNTLAGDSTGVELVFTQARANKGLNKATLSISSNDPNNPVLIIPISYYTNDGPQFELGTETTIKTSENSLVEIKIKAVDNEGDDFTMRLAENYEFVESSFAPGVLSISYSPDYNSAGINTFVIIAEDVLGNANSFNLHVEVENVNRPPLATDMGTIDLYMTGNYYNISLAELFTDPDGDDMTLKAVSSTEHVKLFSGEGEYAIAPVSTGNAVVSFVAYDIYADSATNNVDVVVKESSGLEELDANSLNISPNPATELITIHLEEKLMDEFSVVILDAVGNVVKTELYSRADDFVRLSISELPEGVYLVQLNSNNHRKSMKLIKQ